MIEEKGLSRSASVVSRTMFEAMRMIKENGGAMPFTEIEERIPQHIQFSEWESERTSEKTPQPRWLVNTVFYSIEYMKAGLIRKDSGVWYLTAEGEKALSLTAGKVFDIAHTAYRQYKKTTNRQETMDSDMEEVTELTNEMVLSEAQDRASEGIRKQLRAVSPYEFQDMCAALLRAMGFYTPFVAPKGKDGGVDVIAYENAAGVGRRIICQVKHMPTTAIDVTVVRNLAALLKKDGDTGIIFSSGTFTNDAIRFAREHKNNIRLIGANELVKLWIDNYGRISDEGKVLLPLTPVYYVTR